MMLWQLFISFLKIGAFTLGGGIAMIPIMRREVVEKHQWLTDMDFIDGVAAAQSSPGPIAINMSIYVGYRIKGIPGMLVSVLGSVLPSFTSIIIIASLFTRYAEEPLVRKAFHALEPAVVSLIAWPLIEISQKVGLSWRNFWIPLAALIAVAFAGISPMYVIIVCIALTLIISHINQRRGKN